MDTATKLGKLQGGKYGISEQSHSDVTNDWRRCESEAEDTDRPRRDKGVVVWEVKSRV